MATMIPSLATSAKPGPVQAVFLIFLLLLAPLSACSKEKAQDFQYRKPAEINAPLQKYNFVKLNTSMGSITLKLHWEAAPRTCRNFAKLVEKNYYNDVIFHRVIPDFMIQTGDPTGTGRGGKDYQGGHFNDEINADALGLDKKMLKESRRYYQQDMGKLVHKRIQEKNIEDPDERRAVVEEVMNMSVKELLQHLGYTFTKGLPSLPAKRGAVAMANSGPDTNGSQFFINVKDTPWLNGKHTVFATVKEGMDLVDAISKVQTGERNKPREEVKIISAELLESM